LFSFVGKTDISPELADTLNVPMELHRFGFASGPYLFNGTAGLFSAFRKVSPCFIFRHFRAAFRVLYSYLMNFVTVEYHA
jgi:hypothetical protein